MSSVEHAVIALRAGEVALLPTDTVYGLAVSPYAAAPTHRLQELKNRSPTQPIALLAADVDLLLECVPELRGRSATIARALLPGPYTLVLSNPAERFPWLAGDAPQTIGVRVPELTGVGREVLDTVGAVAATSANVSGGAAPRSLADVAEEIVAGCAAVVDGGELPGAASTVLDFTGTEPRVLREGAASSDEALRLALEAVG